MALLLVRCSGTSNELGAKPDNLVEADKMANILVEVHLSEARVAKLGLTSTDSAALVFKRLQTATLKKFDVDTAAYTQSYIYYSARPAKLAGIYEKVLDKLKVIERKASANVGKRQPGPTI